MVFHDISSNIDEVLSINPSTSVFVFGDINVYHKHWLTCIVGLNPPPSFTKGGMTSSNLAVRVVMKTFSRKEEVELKGDYLERGKFFALTWNFCKKEKNICSTL